MSSHTSQLSAGKQGSAGRPDAVGHVADWLVLTIACIAQFMVILDVSVVNVALPSIRNDLGFTQTGLQWVVNAYTLSFAGFLLLGGRAADIYGRKRVFMFGLALFVIASLVGGLAQNQLVLILARAAQGLGGAVLSPATLTILTTTFTEGKARARAMGAWSAVAGAGGATGALLGGVITNYSSWRWILFINIPIGVGALIAAGIYLRESHSESADRRVDLAGAVLVTVGLTSLVYGVVRTDAVGWGARQTMIAFAIAVLTLVWFVFHEWRIAKVPLMPLRLFRSRSVSGANVVMLGLGASLFAMWFFMSLYLQGVLGYSPLKTGLAFFPQALAIIAGAQISSRLVGRIGARPLLIFGPLLSAFGLLWLSRIGVQGHYWSDLFGPSVLVTLGGGLSFAPVALAATAGVDAADAGLASGLVNTARQVGGSIGLAALATVASGRSAAVVATFSRNGIHPGRELIMLALTDGYSEAFTISACIAVLAALAALVVPPHRERLRAASANE